MLPFNEKTLDAWLTDYEEFNRAFRLFCFANFRAFGLHADFIPGVTKQLHEQWATVHEKWLADETPASTTRLSHVKICALLLHSLISEPFLGHLFDYDYDEVPIYSFKGTEEERVKGRQDLIDGREAHLAFDFVVLCIDWFERNRTDRADVYVQRLTHDMKHDIMNYLLSGSVDPKALYLILKGVYLRPAKNGGSAN